MQNFKYNKISEGKVSKCFQSNNIVKKVYNLDDIVKFNENSLTKTLNKKIKIATNSIQAVQAIKEMQIVKGEGTILLLFEGKTINIGEKFQINDILTEKLRNIPEIESVELC